jgi:uncharacterized protein with HEPN domain
MSKDIDRLYDIAESIQKINESLKNIEFYRLNQLEQLGIIYLLQIIGEASGAITDKFKDKNCHIPWKKIKAFRNFVAHQYFDVDLEIIRDIVENNLPVLEKQIDELIQELEKDNANKE